MTADPKTAALALHRFGLGPRSGSIAAIQSDPRGAMLADLDKPGAGQIAPPELMTSAQAARAAFEFRAERQAAVKKEQVRRKAMADAGSMDSAEAEIKPAALLSPEERENSPQRILLKEAQARIEAALGAEIGFAERLVWFWSNHFCISADKVPAVAGGYEREAIRPHVLGRFADMLLAVESHPAMLFYLDNARSIGPDSIAGINRDKGLNENLAREILELHTLGVRAGYTQDDVIRFAKVLTGWTIVAPRNDPAHGGEFTFIRRRHEPGPQTVIGKVYDGGGIAQGRDVLTDLARHPATATHVSFKMARHFVADQPPPALVSKLTKTFRDTGGDLKAMARTLVAAPEAWDAPRAKLKSPSQWIAASMRATGAKIVNVQRVVGAQALLGEPLWRPPAPKGFSDEESAWIDGLALRLDVASALAGRVGELLDPPALVDQALGPLATAETREIVERAESRSQALALLLMSAEFQRS